LCKWWWKAHESEVLVGKNVKGRLNFMQRESRDELN